MTHDASVSENPRHPDEIRASERGTVPIEKKLENLRRILLIAFFGVTLPVAILIVLASFFLGSVEVGSGLMAGLSGPFLLGMALLGAAVVIAAVCLVIYYVVRAKLERDEELFL